MSNKQERNFSVSVDQVDGFGYGGDYLESFIYETLLRLNQLFYTVK